MPQQEVFFEQMAGGRRIEVLKTYDQGLAREAFDHMDQAAQAHLWSSLKLDDKYDPEDIPPFIDPESSDFLWEELLDEAREDWNLLSFFVVNEARSGRAAALYVSPDWPSAEAFAKSLIAAVH